MFREPNVRLLGQKLGSRLESIAQRGQEPPPAVLPMERNLIIGPDSGTLAGSAA